VPFWEIVEDACPPAFDVLRNCIRSSNFLLLLCKWLVRADSLFSIELIVSIVNVFVVPLVTEVLLLLLGSDPVKATLLLVKDGDIYTVLPNFANVQLQESMKVYQMMGKMNDPQLAIARSFVMTQVKPDLKLEKVVEILLKGQCLLLNQPQPTSIFRPKQGGRQRPCP
jgi:hypothetical protein